MARMSYLFSIAHLEGEAEVEIRGQCIGHILKGKESHPVAMELELH